MGKDPPHSTKCLQCEAGAHYIAQVPLELPMFLLLPPSPKSKACHCAWPYEKNGFKNTLKYWQYIL